MTCELSERFRYDGGEPMNGYYMCSELTEEELDVCFVLVVCGPLGLKETKVKRSRVDIAVVEALVKEGIVRKTSLLQLARDLVEDESRVQQMREWRDQGGFLALERAGDKDIFRAFDQALEIVERGETAESLATRYQVIADLYRYIELIYDDR